MKTLATIGLAMMVLGGICTFAMAAEEKKTDAATVQAQQDDEHIKRSAISLGTGFAAGGACVGAGLAAIGGGYAIARVGGTCIESMARQPEAAGSMFMPMIVTAAMIEGAMLFAIVVSLMAVLYSF